jgi:hypothetical protein
MDENKIRMTEARIATCRGMEHSEVTLSPLDILSIRIWARPRQFFLILCNVFVSQDASLGGILAGIDAFVTARQQVRDGWADIRLILSVIKVS